MTERRERAGRAAHQDPYSHGLRPAPVGAPVLRPYRPRTWLNDVAFAEGRGGPEERPLHPRQQALEPVRHWVRQVSEPGELIVDPFLGSGTTAMAAVMEGRRFIGCDVDPGCVETTRRRLVELVAGATEETGDAPA
jgi:DNA modification methylase